MQRAALAAAISDSARLTGSFLLRSGQRATEYFDKYQFESDPVLLAEVAAHLAPLVPAGVQLLGGLELGGVPIATALSLRSGLPAVFVRKQAKTYGTARLAEGADVFGRRLLVVEDVVTSAGQVAMSTVELRRLGAEVTDAICVLDREQGGAAALAEIGVRLHPLFVASELTASTGC